MFDALHAEFGFTMDGAASPENALLPRFSSAEAPLPWDGERVFCNPPWGDIRTFIDKAPASEISVFVLPARINTKWFHHALDMGFRYRIPKKRINYTRPNWKKRAPMDSIVLLWGDSLAA